MDSLNGREISRKKLEKELKKILHRKTVVNAGGILFKAQMKKEKYSVGMVPYFWYGERKYHYDIHLPEEDEYTLFGNISTEGIISIFFKMEDINETAIQELKKRYSRFATMILSSLTDMKTELDSITLQLLKSKKIAIEKAEILEDLILNKDHPI